MHPLGRNGCDGCALARLGRLRQGRQSGRSRHSRFSVDRHWRGEAIPFPDHCFDEMGLIRIVAQHHSDLANGCVDALIDINENGRAPKPVSDLFARNQLSAFLYQKEEQLHRLFFEAEDAFAPLQPIPRLVKCEIPEMEYLGRTCPQPPLDPGTQDDAT